MFCFRFHNNELVAPHWLDTGRSRNTVTGLSTQLRIFHILELGLPSHSRPSVSIISRSQWASEAKCRTADETAVPANCLSGRWTVSSSAVCWYYVWTAAAGPVQTVLSSTGYMLDLLYTGERHPTVYRWREVSGHQVEEGKGGAASL